MIILLNKKTDLTPEEFAKHFLEIHAPLAKKMPGLRKYVVNLVKRPPGRDPEYDGVAELWFDDADSMKAAFASPEGVTTQKDRENFARKRTALYVDENVIA